VGLKSKVLALAAALTLVSSAGLAGAITSPGSAQAATPSCGTSCVNTYPQEYAGTSLNAPQDVVDVLRQGDKVGQPIILFRSANFDPAEDWTYTDQDPASDFYAAGLLTAALALHYGCISGTTIVSGQIQCAAGGVDDNAFQIQYAPFGVDSGLCLGVAATAVSGEGVTLQPCGVSSKTTWIQDTYSNDGSPSTPAPGPSPAFWAAVNGSGTDFSNPLVLTYPGNANPVDKPRVQLVLQQLAQFSNGVTPTPAPTTGSNVTDDSNQLWTAFEGILP
jgi:hypothetical protein